MNLDQGRDYSTILLKEGSLSHGVTLLVWCKAQNSSFIELKFQIPQSQAFRLLVFIFFNISNQIIVIFLVVLVTGETLYALGILYPLQWSLGHDKEKIIVMLIY